MPISLTFSNQTERLFEVFREQVRERWEDPFAPPNVIVQNRLVDKWIKLQLAEHNGVVAGLKTEFLEKWLWKWVAEPHQKMLRAEHLQIAILKVLGQKDLPIAVQDYLSGDDTVVYRKRVQLAQRLAGLFLEYQTNRPLILENGKVTSLGWGWDKNIPPFNTSTSSIYTDNLETDLSFYFYKNIKDDERRKVAQDYESWQLDIYKRARALCHPNFITLPELWIQKWNQLSRIDGPGPILFGTSGLSLFHRHCLVQLADARKWGAGLDVSVYLLNPCAEFWEDVQTDREKSFRNRNNRGQKYFQKSWSGITEVEPGELWVDSKDHRLLEQWGQAGRDNIALWCQAAQYNIDFIDAHSMDKPSVLHALQDSLLARNPDVMTQLSVPDSSLSILAVPGIIREVECLRDRILRLLAQNPKLQLHQIGVFCPDPAKYSLAFAQVFGIVEKDEPHYIPYEFTEESAGNSLYTSGLKALFALSSLEFTRAQVFELLRNPLVQAAKGYTAEQEQSWESWANDLNVYRGWDRQTRAKQGEYQPTGQHTWMRAIERLLMGRIAINPVVLSGTHIHKPSEHILPWSDMESADPSMLMDFVRVLEDLFEDAKLIANNGVQSWCKWADFVQNCADQWLDIPNKQDDDRNYAPEKAVRANLYSVLEDLRVFEFESSWQEFKLVLEGRLDTELPARGSILGGKLMVCTLREARPLPWEHAFVLGMQAGDFPPNEREDRLDLRYWKPIPGDSHPRRSMQYAFLELIASVRESLTLSYQCELLKDGSPILPSSTLLELQRFVQQTVTDFKEEKIVLLAEEDHKPLVLWPSIEALQKARAVYLNFNLNTSNTSIHTDPQTIQNSIRLTIQDLPSNKGLDWAGLKYMLRNPLEYTLRRTLKVFDEESMSATMKADIPVAWEQLDKWGVTQTWLDDMTEALLGDIIVPNLDLAQIQQVAHDVWILTCNKKVAEGIAPEGVLALMAGELVFKGLKDFINMWDQLIQQYHGYLIEKNYYERSIVGLCEGNSKRFIRLIANHSAVQHEVFIYLTASKLSPKNLLDVYILTLWRALLGKSETEIFVIGKPSKSENSKFKANFFKQCNISQADAKDIVSQLVADSYDVARCMDMMPIEAICDSKLPDKHEVREWLEKQLDGSEYSDYHLPLEIMQCIETKVPDNVSELWARRFGVWLTSNVSSDA